MPTFEHGDMWSAFEEADLFLITTNAFLREGDSSLVMGAGIARQARERFPGIEEALGRAVAGQCGHRGIYSLLVSERWPVAKLGAFQTKQHFKTSSDLVLIRRSTEALLEWLDDKTASSELPHQPQIHLNFPGIGCGRLDPCAVRPILDPLPPCVRIWQRASS